MGLFDRIAPVYGLFYGFQERYYQGVLEKVADSGCVDWGDVGRVLDVGCGTGALCSTLHDLGLSVTGADPSAGMLAQARQKLRYKPVELLHIAPQKPLPFPDHSFDMVIASYVAHGLTAEARQDLYREMRRLSKKFCVIHDYNQNKRLLTSVVEYLEGGDYFNFIQVVEQELSAFSSHLKTIQVGPRAAWYVCYR